jgi:hypothetical protein
MRFAEEAIPGDVGWSQLGINCFWLTDLTFMSRPMSIVQPGS